jgi:signal transduction histidine kinase/CheY-like chemotaxis protein
VTDLELQPLEQRVLLRTATSKDAAMTVAVLQRAGIEAVSCRSVDAVVHELSRGAGALLLAEEALGDPAIVKLTTVMRGQPAWSDLPVLVLARAGADSAAIVEAMDLLANVTVIERPLRISSLVSSMRSALRARVRQYELRAVLDGLRQADQRKTEFLATLAHELRNPLAPLSTSLGILTRGELDPVATQAQYETMTRQVDHMVRLVNDLMEVSRITRGRIELQPEFLSLDDVVNDAIDLSRPLLEASGHVLQVEIAPGTWRLRGDRVRLTQIFSNLLNNAAKYTPRAGRVRLRIDRDGDMARVRVGDDGTGVPSEMLDQIFDMFVQVSGTSRAAQGGLGIGLTLVKSLVELHGGTVEAFSEGVGKGTEITVRLPLSAEARNDPPPMPAPSPAQEITGDILIVDDNRDAADSLSTLLELLGASTAVAYDGQHALQVAADCRPSIAILDIGMPGMDGCELAQRLRRDPRHAGLQLIALTGWGQPEDRVRIMAAGFDHHFLKPVDIDELAAVVQPMQARG